MAEVEDILAKILRLRGAEYVCLAHRTDGRIVGEAGHDESATTPGGAAKLKTMLPGICGSAADDELEDIIVSSRHRYHLIRNIETTGTEPLLLYLRMRRPQANLALARRELASTTLTDLLTGLREPDSAGSEPVPTESPPDQVVMPLPRRTPESSHWVRAAWADQPEPHEPGEGSSVLRQRWVSDAGTLERLVRGLRQLKP